jgi:hypothetical protein
MLSGRSKTNIEPFPPKLILKKRCKLNRQWAVYINIWCKRFRHPYSNPALLCKGKVIRPPNRGTQGSSGTRHSFLTFAIDGGEWSTSRPKPLYPRRRSFQSSLNRKPSGLQSRSGRFFLDKTNVLPPCPE